MSSDAKVVFVVTLFFDDGSEKTFRTDEWNETILRDRLEATGKKIIREQRRQLGEG